MGLLLQFQRTWLPVWVWALWFSTLAVCLTRPVGQNLSIPKSSILNLLPLDLPLTLALQKTQWKGEKQTQATPSLPPFRHVSYTYFPPIPSLVFIIQFDILKAQTQEGTERQGSLLWCLLKSPLWKGARRCWVFKKNRKLYSAHWAYQHHSTALWEAVDH